MVSGTTARCFVIFVAALLLLSSTSTLMAKKAIEYYPAFVEGKKYYFKLSGAEKLLDYRRYYKHEELYGTTWKTDVEYEHTGSEETSGSQTLEIEIKDIAKSEDEYAFVIVNYKDTEEVKYKSKMTTVDKVEDETYTDDHSLSSKYTETVENHNISISVHDYGEWYIGDVYLPIENVSYPYSFSIYLFPHTENISKYLKNVKDFISNSSSKDKYNIEFREETNRVYLKLTVEDKEFKNTYWFSYGNWSEVSLTLEIEYDLGSGVLKKCELKADAKYNYKSTTVWSDWKSTLEESFTLKLHGKIVLTSLIALYTPYIAIGAVAVIIIVVAVLVLRKKKAME